MPDDRTLYYAVHLSTRATSRRGTAWCWSPAYDTAAEATHAAKDAVRTGNASLAFLVRFADGAKTVICGWPQPLWRAIQHYQELANSLE